MSDDIIRKIAVIFVVDVVGYSRHMEVNEMEQYTAIMNVRKS